jgi:hypothetical protein
MARHIIRNRILDAEKLKAYSDDGYRYSAVDSTADEWVYLREAAPQGPPSKLAGGRIRQ